jgi:hypothetical protein
MIAGERMALHPTGPGPASWSSRVPVRETAGSGVALGRCPVRPNASAWRQLHGTSGDAAAVPGYLRGLRGADARVRREARTRLSDLVWHQGTRWQTSAHVVPFLVALIDEPDTPDRAALAALLHAVAIGDRTDADLPFESGSDLRAARAVTQEQADAVIRYLYNFKPRPTLRRTIDSVALRWDADAYRAAAGHGPGLSPLARRPRRRARLP